MSFAAFVDTPNAKQDLAIELAIALAEFCVEENEPLFLLADAVTALEVGLSVIGSRQSRTVEGGEYRASPIVLLPFIPRPNTGDGDILRSVSESGAGGEIDELYELGLFARRGERTAEYDIGDDPAYALEEVVARLNPSHILGLGQTSDYWQAIGSGLERASPRYAPQFITIEGFGLDDVFGQSERTFVCRPAFLEIRRPERVFARDEDDLEAIRREAERDGALVAGFLDYLIGHSRRGREPFIDAAR